MIDQKRHFPISEIIKSGWIIIAALITIIYWAARQDSSLEEIKEHKIKINGLESRITLLESGLDKIQVKIDDIKEDLSLIKSAVLK